VGTDAYTRRLEWALVNIMDTIPANQVAGETGLGEDDCAQIHAIRCEVLKKCGKSAFTLAEEDRILHTSANPFDIIRREDPSERRKVLNEVAEFLERRYRGI
jgi:hypothetical protein